MDLRKAKLAVRNLQSLSPGKIDDGSFEGAFPSWNGKIEGRDVEIRFASGESFKTIGLEDPKGAAGMVASIEVTSLSTDLTLLVTGEQQDDFAKYMKNVGFVTEVEVGIKDLDDRYLIQTGDDAKVKKLFAGDAVEVFYLLEPFLVLDAASGRLKLYCQTPEDVEDLGKWLFEKAACVARFASELER